MTDTEDYLEAPAPHTHEEADITDLIANLASKSNVGHTHIITDPTFDLSQTHPFDRLSNGDIDLESQVSSWHSARAYLQRSSGKLYFEFLIITANSNYFLLGIGSQHANLNSHTGSDIYSYGYQGNTGEKFHNAGQTAYGSAYTQGDIIGVAVDLDAGKIWWSKNNVWQATGDPENGTNPAYTNLYGYYFPMASCYTTGNKARIFGRSEDLTYSPPNGFSPWYD